jgi:hypothetical protein
MIQKLTDTYISLSLSDIAKAVSLPLDEAGLREAHAEIQRMVSPAPSRGEKELTRWL